MDLRAGPRAVDPRRPYPSPEVPQPYPGRHPEPQERSPKAAEGYPQPRPETRLWSQFRSASDRLGFSA